MGIWLLSLWFTVRDVSYFGTDHVGSSSSKCRPDRVFGISKEEVDIPWNTFAAGQVCFPNDIHECKSENAPADW